MNTGAVSYFITVCVLAVWIWPHNTQTESKPVRTSDPTVELAAGVVHAFGTPTISEDAGVGRAAVQVDAGSIVIDGATVYPDQVVPVVAPRLQSNQECLDV